MDRIEQTRVEWQHAQAELQMALANLERLVATESAGAAAIEKARAVATVKQKAADELLQRHITQLGKPE